MIMPLMGLMSGLMGTADCVLTDGVQRSARPDTYNEKERQLSKRQT